MKAKTFTNINFKEGRQSARRVACVLLYSLFLSPKSVSAVRLYGDETDIRRFCIFFELPTWLPKKAQTEKVKMIIFSLDKEIY